MTQGFSTKKLKVETDDGLNMSLLEEFSYTTAKGEVIVVPVGSLSDGASTPRALWVSLPPFGRYWMAAFLHDYLYRKAHYPKKFCDDTLYEAMIYLGVDQVTAHTIYNGVALGGFLAFEMDRKELAETEAEDAAKKVQIADQS